MEQDTYYTNLNSALIQLTTVLSNVTPIFTESKTDTEWRKVVSDQAASVIQVEGLITEITYKNGNVFERLNFVEGMYTLAYRDNGYQSTSPINDGNHYLVTDVINVFSPRD